MLSAFDHSNERLRPALEAGRVGTWEWDLASERIMWSPALEGLHGIPAGGFPGTLEAYQETIHPDDRGVVLRAFQDALSNRDDLHVEHRILLPDGSVRWLEVHGALAIDAEGVPVRLAGVGIDVTARKAVELDRIRSLEELRRIGAARERFLGLVAHDLRNPLNAVHIWTHNLLMSSETTEDGAAIARRIAQSSKKMSGIINDLLDFTDARLGSGMALNPDEVDMAAVGRAAVEELRLARAEREILYETRGDLRGRWDPIRVARVITSLLENLLVRGEGAVYASLEGRGDEVLMEIGSGHRLFPEGSIPALFDPFGRTDQVPGGLRRDLYIVQAIVKAHGGTVDVISSEVGTLFQIRWPTSSPAGPSG